MSDSSPKTLVIAGGGTGGHVLPGVAIADEWKKRFGPHARVLFVGSKGGIEEKLVPASGYPLALLRIGALKRSSLGRVIKTIVQIPLAFVDSVKILLRERPGVVIGVGGFASGPFVLVAAVVGGIFCGTRTAILEPNAFPGLTNRILGLFVSLVFSVHEGLGIVSGYPIRSRIEPLEPAPDKPFTVFVFGGSQGAIAINSLVIASLPFLSDLKSDLRFIHQTGERDFDRVLHAYQEAGVTARVEKFIHDMRAAYAEASLLICRAGASTLAEVAAVRRAAIFVPLPTAADDHQSKNAQEYVQAGAAWMVDQRTIEPDDFAMMIREFYENPSRLRGVEKLVSAFYRPHAARDILDRILEPS